MDLIRKTAIVGVTGFVGGGLPGLLADKGIRTTGVSRAGKGDLPGVSDWQTPDRMDFSGHDAVINLAGEPIDKRWNESNRRLFRESRVGLTTKVVEAIAKLPEGQRPKVLINASAVGIYGHRGDEILPESASPGTGYLADLCADWENAARGAEALGVRVIRLRIGIVLGKNGPAYEKLRTILKLGIGGRLGSGCQWMPWIHLEDLRAAIIHCVLSDNIEGPVNGTAPNPETNRDFTRKFAANLHRPAILPAPAFALRLALGEFSTALLGSHRAIPTALEADGFTFRYPILEAALDDLAG